MAYHNWKFRFPHTTQERRLSYDDWDGSVRIRPRRNARHIPSAWDDLHLSHGCDTNWKRFRRHQWKPKHDRPKNDSRRYAKHMARRGTQKQWWGFRPA